MTLPWITKPGRRWWQAPVGWTLALSLAIHVLLLVLWTAVPTFLRNHPDWQPRWLRSAVVPPKWIAQKTPPEPLSPDYPPKPDEYEIPLSFIEVDPALAVDEKPKDARFQSTANTLAQNVAAPNPELNQPFIGGTQERFPKLFDTEKPKPRIKTQPKTPPEVDLADTDRPPQEAKVVPPAPPPVPAKPPITPPPPAPDKPVAVQPKEPEKPISRPSPVSEKPPETRPKDEVQLAMIKPGPVTPPRPAQQPAPPPAPQVEQSAPAPPDEPRPTRRSARKSLADARRDKGILVGQQMKQDGGVERHGIASVSVQRGPMGDYGARMWAAVQERWYATLEAQKFAGEFRGKVVIQFKLHPDGNVSEVDVKNQGVDDGIYAMYSIAAIQLSASFGPWSNEMRTAYGPQPIDCQCVFWY